MKRSNLVRRREVLAGMAAVAGVARGARAQTASQNPRLRITDAQVHIWSGGAPTAAQRQQPVTKDQLLAEMAEAGVERAIIVPTTWDPRGNDTALEAARAHPHKLAVMGLLDLSQSGAGYKLEAWRQQPGMLGIRLFLASRQGSEAIEKGLLDWLWAGAEKVQLPLMIHAGGLLRPIATVAERHPGLRLCLDSLGAAPRTLDSAAFTQLPDLLAMARLRNVVVKAEGMPAQSSEPYPHRGLHEHLRRIYDAFGPQRLFWGSDLTRLKGTTYRQCVTLFTQELDWLSDADKRLIMGDALSTWIGWPLPE